MIGFSLGIYSSLAFGRRISGVVFIWVIEVVVLWVKTRLRDTSGSFSGMEWLPPYRFVFSLRL